MGRKAPLCLLQALLLAVLLCSCGAQRQEKDPLKPDISVMGLADTAGEEAPAEFSPDLSQRNAVDDSYFLDAAFFGNSIMEGVAQFGGLRYGAFFAATSTAVFNLDTTANTKLSTGESATLYQALTEFPRGKIYVLLGVNEIGYDRDYFIKAYGELLDRLRTDEPNAVLYVLSMTPVTKEKSDNHELFNMPRIRDYNSALHSLCQEKGCYYVDLVECLADYGGYLPEEIASGDGIHPTGEGYARIADWLRTHYAGEYRFAMAG